MDTSIDETNDCDGLTVFVRPEASYTVYQDEHKIIENAAIDPVVISFEKDTVEEKPSETALVSKAILENLSWFSSTLTKFQANKDISAANSSTGSIREGKAIFILFSFALTSYIGIHGYAKRTKIDKPTTTYTIFMLMLIIFSFEFF